MECMFVKACNTNSQLRKAISHIFGRNKLCTRQMPQEIWVHFCRKHYQRARYRNPNEYSKLQCDLVYQQIVRIHEWSRSNTEARPQRPGVVRGWELTARKREKNRLNELSTPNRKRGADTLFEGDDDEDYDEDSFSVVTRPSHVLTAVPQWLLDQSRPGYTTREILEVFCRLHTEILSGELAHFPDIEILPDITTDTSLPKSLKRHGKRTPASAYRHTQSLGSAVQSMSASPSSCSRQTSVWNEDAFGSPQQTRHRISEHVEEGLNDYTLTGSQNINRPMDNVRHVRQFSHRLVFADIRENQCKEYSGNIYYTNSPSSYLQTPLPAPTPQQSKSQSMAAHLENNISPSIRGSLHGRSQSDISDFGHSQMDYTSPSSGFSTGNMHQAQSRPYQPQEPGQSSYGYSVPQHQYPEQQYTQQQHPRQQYPQQQYHDEFQSPCATRWSEQGKKDAMPGSQGHHRHQSTPRKPSYDPSPSKSYGPFASRRIIETEEARNVFSARR